MGQVSPIKKKNERVLSDDEKTAISHLVWIHQTLGKKYEMVPYFVAMTIQEIKEAPIIDVTAEPQLAVADALAALADDTP